LFFWANGILLVLLFVVLLVYRLVMPIIIERMST